MLPLRSAPRLASSRTAIGPASPPGPIGDFEEQLRSRTLRQHSVELCRTRTRSWPRWFVLVPGAPRVRHLISGMPLLSEAPRGCGPPRPCWCYGRRGAGRRRYPHHRQNCQRRLGLQTGHRRLHRIGTRCTTGSSAAFSPSRAEERSRSASLYALAASELLTAPNQSLTVSVRACSSSSVELASGLAANGHQTMFCPQTTSGTVIPGWGVTRCQRIAFGPSRMTGCCCSRSSVAARARSAPTCQNPSSGKVPSALRRMWASN